MTAKTRPATRRAARALPAAGLLSVVGAGSDLAQETTLQIRFSLDGKVVAARFEDSRAARGFLAKLRRMFSDGATTSVTISIRRRKWPSR